MAPGLSGAGVVALTGSFGPFDALADRSHGFYLDGFSDLALVAAREALPVAVGAGDVQTTRFLHYTCATALIELRRWDEAVEEAHRLLAAVDPQDGPWRAKALSLLGDSSLRMGRVAQAVDALAEAYSLVESAVPKRYNELSAAMGVAIVLGHAQLFEPAQALFTLCLTSPAARVNHPTTRQARRLVLQELAVLNATWGAALELDGRRRRARAKFLRSAEISLQLMREADGHDPEMYARAEVVEAFAQARLGQVDLAAARLRAATSRFVLRPELPEVLIGRLGLALADTEHGRFEQARDHLRKALDGAVQTDRIVWELSALTAQALVELAEHGEHPAAPYLLEARRSASHRLWVERESRFFALRDRMSLRALAAEASQLTRDAFIDPLTGLGNRRMLDAGIAKAVAGAAIFVVDVDRFKPVNDRFGHAVGDQVLQRVADILRAHCRGQDVVVRFGGDEFVVLLPITSAVEAGRVGERVRSAVARERWAEVAAGLAVSVSVGVSGAGHGAERVLAAADQALYVAKETGRDRVVVN